MRQLKEQPRTAPTTETQLRTLVQRILMGETARSRPALFLAVEAHATEDLIDLLEPVLGDDITYNGLASTFADALAEQSGANAGYIRYNFVRLHVLRARLLRGTARDRLLAAALREAQPLPANDPGTFLAQGDIAVELGDMPRAEAAYRKTIPLLGTSVPALYRLGVGYQRNNRPDAALSALNDAIRADAASSNGGRLYKHRIYQAIGTIQLTRNQLKDALDSLQLSTKVRQEESAPFRFQTTLALELLARGYRKEAAAFARTALMHFPGDIGAKALLDQAETPQ